MSLSNNDTQKSQKLILPNIHCLDQMLFDNLNSDEFCSQENSINKTFFNKNLDKKLSSIIKEDNNTQEILNVQFKNKIEDITINSFNYNKFKPKLPNKKCGRKRKRNKDEIQKQEIDEDKSQHNKFSDDNIRRKCKHLVLKNALNFINDKIKNIYNGNIGNGLLKKELQTINQFQKFNVDIKYNKEFLYKTLGKIFSENISGRYAYIPLNHNKVIINSLMNEKDEDKRIYFIKLFNINFIQCLNHFIGKEKICELEGLKTLQEIKNEEILIKYPLDGEDYYNTLHFYLNNYEEIINSKKPRKFRKKK